MSSIVHPDHATPALRSSYLLITNHNPIEAALLSLMEKWAAEGGSDSYHRHITEFIAGLIGLASEPTIRHKIRSLTDKGYISVVKMGPAASKHTFNTAAINQALAERAMPPRPRVSRRDYETIRCDQPAVLVLRGEPDCKSPRIDAVSTQHGQKIVGLVSSASRRATAEPWMNIGCSFRAITSSMERCSERRFRAADCCAMQTRSNHEMCSNRSRPNGHPGTHETSGASLSRIMLYAGLSKPTVIAKLGKLIQDGAVQRLEDGTTSPPREGADYAPGPVVQKDHRSIGSRGGKAALLEHPSSKAALLVKP